MSLSKQMQEQQASSAGGGGGGAPRHRVQWKVPDAEDRDKKQLQFRISKRAFVTSALKVEEYGKGGTTILWNEEKMSLRSIEEDDDLVYITLR